MKIQQSLMCVTVAFVMILISTQAFAEADDCEVPLVGSVGVLAVPIEMTLSNNYLYVTNLIAAPSVVIYDVSDRTQPVFVGEYSPPEAFGGHTFGHTVQAFSNPDILYITDDLFNSFSIVNTTDKTNPVQLGVYHGSEQMLGFKVHRGEFAYVAAGGLLVLDVSDPSSIQEVGFIELPGNPHDVILGGSSNTPLVYTIDPDFGVTALDISDPSQPTVVGSFDTDGQAMDFAFGADRLFIADGDQGLVILDVSTPSNPQLMSTMPQLGTIDVVDTTFSKGVFAGRKSLDETTIFAINSKGGVDPVVLQTIQVPHLKSLLIKSRFQHSELFVMGPANTIDVFDITCITDCPAEVIGDGMLDFHDVSFFLSIRPDLNGDGNFDFFDISIFLTSYNEGCTF